MTQMVRGAMTSMNITMCCIQDKLMARGLQLEGSDWPCTSNDSALPTIWLQARISLEAADTCRTLGNDSARGACQRSMPMSTNALET